MDAALLISADSWWEVLRNAVILFVAGFLIHRTAYWIKLKMVKRGQPQKPESICTINPLEDIGEDWRFNQEASDYAKKSAERGN